VQLELTKRVLSSLKLERPRFSYTQESLLRPEFKKFMFYQKKKAFFAKPQKDITKKNFRMMMLEDKLEPTMTPINMINYAVSKIRRMVTSELS